MSDRPFDPVQLQAAADTILAAINRNTTAHHSRCLSGQDDERCDCYGRRAAPARKALAALLDRLAATEHERDEARNMSGMTGATTNATAQAKRAKVAEHRCDQLREAARDMLWLTRGAHAIRMSPDSRFVVLEVEETAYERLRLAAVGEGAPDA